MASIFETDANGETSKSVEITGFLDCARYRKIKREGWVVKGPR